MNMMLGPGPSSVATRVIGTGLLENLGWEAWRESDGLSDLTEEGRVSGFVGDFREGGLLPDNDEAFSEVVRLDVDAGFMLCVSGLLSGKSKLLRLEVDAGFILGISGLLRDRSDAEMGAVSLVDAAVLG